MKQIFVKNPLFVLCRIKYLYSGTPLVEGGHPCLVPLCSVNLCDVFLFVVTVAMDVLYSVFIQSMNYYPKPNFYKAVKMKILFMLSIAFCASSETTIVFALLRCEMLIKFRSLLMFLVDGHLLMKLVWSLWIKDGSMVSNQDAMEMILLSVLTNNI